MIKPPRRPAQNDPEDLIAPVREDVRYLIKEWPNGLEDDALRRASPVLRRLLVDGDLQRAWRLAGFEKQPMVTSMSLEPSIAGVDPSRVLLASIGGAKANGVIVGGVLMFNYALSEAELKARAGYGPPVESTLPLRAYAEAPCVMTGGRLISRHTVIKYVANKLGGAHHDKKRGNDKDELAFVLLDKVGRDLRLRVLDKPVVYFELLGIGQVLAKSSDIRKFAGVD